MFGIQRLLLDFSFVPVKTGKVTLENMPEDPKKRHERINQMTTQCIDALRMTPDDYDKKYKQGTYCLINILHCLINILHFIQLSKNIYFRKQYPCLHL